MPRSPLLDPLEQQLIGYNDELCYSLFAEAEVVRLLGRIGPGAQDRYTIDLFSDNPHARRIHVRIADLPAFQERNRAFSFGAYYTVSYEAFSSYYDAVVDLLRQFGTRPVRRRNDSRLERMLEGTFQDSGYGTPDAVIFDTLEYLRLRRNHFIHLADMPSGPYAAITQNRGAIVNAFWGDARLPIDFALPVLTLPGDAEAIALLKVLRICLQRLDEHVVACLDWKAIVASHLKQLIAGAGRDAVQQRPKLARTLSHQLQERLGYSLSGPEATQLVNDAT